MDVEAELGDVGSKKSQPGRRGFWVRCVLVYPLLILAGCHFLMTGSPIPLWWTERLDHPVKVAGWTEAALILADGRHLRLPFIRRLPVSNPAFVQILKTGVEIRPDGAVCGLLTERPYCGNDPYLWYTRPINLSDLAGAIDPDLIDETVIDPEAIRSLQNEQANWSDRNGLPFMVRLRTHQVRTVFEDHRVGTSRL